MITYLKCRSPIMTYVDPQNKFVIQRGKIAKYDGQLTRTMQRWIRRGGLKKVDEALYMQQLESEPKQKTEDKIPEAPKAEPVKESEPEDKSTAPEPQKPAPEEEQPKEKEAKPARKTQKTDKK